MRYKLVGVMVVVGFLFGIGVNYSLASIDQAGGGGSSFNLYFDENGNGSYDKDGLGSVNDPGQTMLDITGGAPGKQVLYYVLPEVTGHGDVRIWEDFEGGTISDVLRFQQILIQGVITNVMIYYSDLGDADLADTGLPVNPNYRDTWPDGQGVGAVENGIEGGVRGFTWNPDGAGAGNQYFGISDVPEAASIIIWFGLSSLFVMRIWRRRRITVPATPSSRLHWSDESRMAIHQIIERGCRH
jgi:hypothetical protein